MRILVTGSRGWPHPEVVYRELDQIIQWSGHDLNTLDHHDWQMLGTPRCQACVRDPVTIVEGASLGGGVDDFAFKWANRQLSIKSERHSPNYAKHGSPACYFIRNQEMVDAGADLCLALRLNGSRGTTDCAERARKAGIPVRLIDLKIEGWPGA